MNGTAHISLRSAKARPGAGPVASPMKISLRTLSLLLGSSLATVLATGQPAAESKRPHFDYSFSGGFTATADVGLGDATLGDVSMTQWRLNGAYKFRPQPEFTFEIGAALDRLELDLSDSRVPLPETLQVVALHLGSTWRISPEWALIAQVRPGSYSDTEADSSDSFSAPGFVIARWSATPELTWFMGFRVDPLGDNVVLPVAGAQWQVRPDWLVSVGFPRTEVAYTYDERTTLFTGASFELTAYAIDDPAIVAPVGTDLRETELEHRAVKVNAGVQRKLESHCVVRLEGGVTLARRFEYFDRNLELEPEAAGYAALTVSAAF